MKAKSLIISGFLAVTFLMLPVGEAFSQRGQNMSRQGTGISELCATIPNITEEQRSQLSQLRTEHQRKMHSFRDQVDANRTQHRELMKSENVDMGAINALQNERKTIRSQMEQKFQEHNQNVRSLLTEEQRAVFDSAEKGGIGLGVNQPAQFGNRNANIQRAMSRLK